MKKVWRIVALLAKRAVRPVSFDKGGRKAETPRMSKLEAIEREIRVLPREQAHKLQDWLAEYLEDRAELNADFVASIERGKADLREGRVRVEKR